MMDTIIKGYVDKFRESFGPEIDTADSKEFYKKSTTNILLETFKSEYK